VYNLCITIIDFLSMVAMLDVSGLVVTFSFIEGRFLRNFTYIIRIGFSGSTCYVRVAGTLIEWRIFLA